VAAGEKELAAVEGLLQRQLQEADASRDRALAEVVAGGRSRLRQARRHLAATKASQEGLRGGFRLELPAAFVLIIALILAAPTLESSPGAPGPWIGGIAGLALALLWGRMVRSRRVRDAAATVQAAEKTLAAEQRDLRARHSREARSLEGAAEKEKAEIRRRLAGLDRERQQLRKDSEKRRRELRRAAQGEDRRSEREKDASVAALGRELIDRLGVQPEAARDRYPPLRKALAAGFQRGSQPGPAAMKMTSSEEMQARLQLAILSGR
jgi:hypothetical protein